MKTIVVLVTGLPASGKSYLAQKLAKDLSLPLFSKDEIKEMCFDELGYSDRAWSKKIGAASIKILDYIFENHLKAQQSFIVESNFKPEFDTEKFQILHKKYAVEFFQICCKADGEILYERFKQRAESGARHPGHDDANNLEEFRETLTKTHSYKLDVPGEYVEIDTTDFNTVNYSAILQQVKAIYTP